MSLWGPLTSILTGGGTDIAKALGVSNNVANSYGTLGLSDLSGDIGLGNLGKAAFAKNDDIMGTGHFNQSVGGVLDYVIPALVSYGLADAGAFAGAGTGAVGEGGSMGFEAMPMDALATQGADMSFGGLGADFGAGVGAGSGLGTGDIGSVSDFGTMPGMVDMNAGWEGGMDMGNVGAGGGEFSGYSQGAMDMGGGDSSSGNSMWDLLKNNKKTAAMVGLNLLNSFNQSNMMKGANEAQQKSYQDYLNSINPTPEVKATRYNTLAGNVDKQTAISQKQAEDALAGRGIRGKGVAAPIGDVSEASRMAKNAAYNQIYGTYNVPSSPGPANYSPSGLNIAGSNATSIANYLLPLLTMASKYGGGGTGSTEMLS